MGKGGAGKGAAPKRWPRVLTSADAAPKQKDPATSLPVDRREEPFLLKHAILEASTWSAAIQPASPRGQTPTAILQAIFSDEEIAQSISSLTPKAAAVDHGPSGEIDVQVLRMSGDSAFVGIVDTDMTVAEFKQKLQANTGINVGWQVLLLGDGRELESEQKLAAYSGEKLEKLDLQLQVFKFRDLCRAAVSTDKYGATLSLLQEAQRGDYAVSCVAAYNLGLKCSESEHIISLQLLAQTLPLQPACQLVVNAIATSSAGLRHQAAIEFARIFHESPESAECLELACNKALAANFSRSDLAQKLFHHLKKRKFPPRPVPYSGTQICLAHRDPVTVGREHLAKYIDFAKSLPAGWHYKTLTPITQGFDIETHLRREAQEAATKSNMDVSLISKCLTWSMTSSSAGRFVAVFLEPSRLFAEKNEQMSDADIFCGIAEHPRIPAEFTRMALECAARLSGWSWLVSCSVQVQLTGCEVASRARTVPENLESHDLNLQSKSAHTALAVKVGAIEGRWQLHAGVLVTKMLQFANRHWRYCSVWARWATCQQFKACCKTGGAPILVESAKRSNVSAPAAKVRRHIPSIQEFECPVPRCPKGSVPDPNEF